MPTIMGPRISKAITFASSGDNSLVTAVAGQVIYVHSMILTVATATTVSIKDGASTSMSGVMTLAAGTPLPFYERPSGSPWFVLTAGNALIVALGGAVQCSGVIEYSQLLP